MCTKIDQVRVSSVVASGRSTFFLSFPHPEPLYRRYLNMSGVSVLAGAHHVVASNTTFNTASTVSSGYYVNVQADSMNLRQMHINNINNRNRTTSDGVIPLTPNPSNRFTGRTEVIAKLKSHFFTNTNDAVKKRKFFLLHGMGGIGKTQICLKFLEDMSDQ